MTRRQEQVPRTRAAARPQRGDVERDQALDPVGRHQGHQERDVAAPVVAHDPDAVQVLGVQEREDVARPRRLRVVAGRRRRPAPAAQVGRDDAVALGQLRDQVPPGPPVLRPAVQEQQGRPAARFGDMQPDLAEIDVAVPDPGHFGHRHRAHRPGLPSRAATPNAGQACAATRTG
jgi:hypothetical protein